MYVLLSVDNYVSPETRPWRENFVRIVNTHIITPRWKYSCWKFPHRITACYSINIIPSSLDPCPSNELCNMCFYHAVLQQCILYCTVLYHIHLVQWFVLYCTNIPLCWIPWQEALWRLDSGVYEGMYKLLCVTRHNNPSSLFRISVW